MGKRDYANEGGTQSEDEPLSYTIFFHYPYPYMYIHLNTYKIAQTLAHICIYIYRRD